MGLTRRKQNRRQGGAWYNTIREMLPSSEPSRRQRTMLDVHEAAQRRAIEQNALKSPVKVHVASEMPVNTKLSNEQINNKVAAFEKQLQNDRLNRKTPSNIKEQADMLRKELDEELKRARPDNVEKYIKKFMNNAEAMRKRNSNSRTRGNSASTISYNAEEESPSRRSSNASNRSIKYKKSYSPTPAVIGGKRRKINNRTKRLRRRS
jgi:hypothetical protein